jgi:serine/threonine kinase 32
MLFRGHARDTSGKHGSFPPLSPFLVQRPGFWGSGRPGVRADQPATIQFLDRDPNRRLGYRPGGGGFEDIKTHPWFRGIDWDAMYKKEVVPPFEPDVSGDVSTSALDLS